MRQIDSTLNRCVIINDKIDQAIYKVDMKEAQEKMNNNGKDGQTEKNVDVLTLLR